MVLDRKQFDDLDDFGDFDEKLDSSLDPDGGPSRSNSTLSWRRIIIERAVNNVRKAMETKADLHTSYKLGSLVFDDEANKFGRVVESRPGFLNVSLLSGGKLVKQDLNQLDFIRKNRQKLTLPEMARELFLSELEVISLLNQIELESEKLGSFASPALARPSKKAPPIAIVKSGKKANINQKPTLKAFLPNETSQKPAKNANKPAIKIAAKSAAKPAPSSTPTLQAKKKAKLSASKPQTFSKLLPKGLSTDPVVDPNCYIKQNFLAMSNKELACATGLSEHTVRRKLGEWGLKRKDFVSKA